MWCPVWCSGVCVCVGGDVVSCEVLCVWGGGC